MIKILIHGATDFNSSNFGDYLYVDGTIRRIKASRSDALIKIAKPSEYFLQHLPAFKQADFSNKDADLLIYAPGGYFGEGHSYRFRDILIHFWRFMPVGLAAVNRHQRILIVGVGAGPIKSRILRWSIKRICSHSEGVYVRDEESRNALTELGIKDVKLSFDPILVLPLSEWYKEFDISKLTHKTNEILLVHYNHSMHAMELFAKAVRDYVTQRKSDVTVIVSSDQLLDYEDRLYEQFCFISKVESIHYQYSDPYEFISLIRQCNKILTCKLHVGVVGHMLGASVICVAEHPEKSHRYYDRQGCPERCLSLYDVDYEETLSAMNSLFDASMPKFSEDILQLSESAWCAMDKSLE